MNLDGMNKRLAQLATGIEQQQREQRAAGDASRDIIRARLARQNPEEQAEIWARICMKYGGDPPGPVRDELSSELRLLSDDQLARFKGRVLDLDNQIEQ